MLHNFPALNALRAFEAAARHLSFKKAAEELHVTAGAISQQIKRLEQDLEVTLFARTPVTILTQPGRDYFIAVRKAFERMSEATTQLRADAGQRTNSARPLRMNISAGLSTLSMRLLRKPARPFRRSRSTGCCGAPPSPQSS